MKSILLPVVSLALVFMTAAPVAAQSEASGSLPEKMVVKLDFTQGWPFEEPARGEDEQNRRGETYVGDTYTFAYEDASAYGEGEFQLELPFFFRGNGEPYVYVRKRCFFPGSKNCRMTIPAVEGMRLESVTMETRNGASFPKGFKIKREDFSDIAECQTPSYKGAPAVVGFPTPDGADTEPGERYFMSFTDAGTQITTITIVYMK